jgi:hypothetical protein
MLYLYPEQVTFKMMLPKEIYMDEPAAMILG